MDPGFSRLGWRGLCVARHRVDSWIVVSGIRKTWFSATSTRRPGRASVSPWIGYRVAPPFMGHHVLPLHGSIATRGTLSVVIEIVFVILTVVALLVRAARIDDFPNPSNEM
ncbi:hypothetical protein SAMN05421799_1243 [Alicyclobacillus vulcanalis]|uniref:Uncharacterized protein n=1 Tax=Alicyclobacillus vulcanalis TaxID=252246 RepID=A0A1N7PX63_9BACL|nr:hypothetical protein SAMN05421799_1243 [Alicyclobacillus vulcanalis]